MNINIRIVNRNKIYKSTESAMDEGTDSESDLGDVSSANSTVPNKDKSDASKDESAMKEKMKSFWEKIGVFFKTLYNYSINISQTTPYILRAKRIALKYKNNNNSLPDGWKDAACKLKPGLTYDKLKMCFYQAYKAISTLQNINITNISKTTEEEWDKRKTIIEDILKPTSDINDKNIQETEVKVGSVFSTDQVLTSTIANIANGMIFDKKISSIFTEGLAPLAQKLQKIADEKSGSGLTVDKNDKSMIIIKDLIVYTKQIIEIFKTVIGAPLLCGETAFKDAKKLNIIQKAIGNFKNNL